MVVGRTRFSFKKVFRLDASDVTDCRENVGAVDSRSFDAVSMVDTSITCLLVDVKLQHHIAAWNKKVDLGSHLTLG